MTLDEFVKKYTGIRTGNTDGNMGQCVGLVSVFMDGLNIPHEWGDAKDLLTNADTKYVDVIKNTPTGVPQAGDIIVWGTKIGAFGHTGLFLRGDSNSFTSFDQNFPLNSLPHEQSHSYSGVLGWLHPKVGQVVSTDVVDEMRLARDNNWNLYEAQIGETQKKQERIQELESENSQLKTDKEQLTKDVNSCETHAGELLTRLEKLNDEDKSTSSQLLDAQKATQPYIDTEKQLKGKLGLFSDATSKDILSAIDNLKASKVKLQPKPITLLEKIKFLFS